LFINNRIQIIKGKNWMRTMLKILSLPDLAMMFSAAYYFFSL
jgi:hypothetical protein